MNIQFSPLSPQNRVTPADPVKRVEGAGQAPEHKSPTFRTPSQRARSLIWTALAREAIPFLSGRGPWGLSFEELTENKEILAKIRELVGLFFTMTRRDCSSEPAFLARFAGQWKLLKDLEHLAMEAGHLQGAGLVTRVEGLLSSYPPGDEFHLAYYLSLSAGEDWFPMPFLLLVRELHLEMQDDPKQAHLTLWIRALCRMLRDWYSETVIERAVEACLAH